METQSNSAPSQVPRLLPDTDSLSTLSRAERAVFNLYLAGLATAEVAARLFISVHTVKSHNKHIYSKLGISSRRELLAYAQVLDGPLDMQSKYAVPTLRAEELASLQVSGHEATRT